MSSKEDEKQEIPEVIHDAGNRISYKKGRFFGKVCMVTFNPLMLLSTVILHIYYTVFFNNGLLVLHFTFFPF